MLLFSLFWTASVFAQTQVRLSWHEFAKDPNRVQSLRNAVAAMKARNNADPMSAEYRLSWIYWANMHGYFGTTAKNGTVAQWRQANNLTGSQYDAAFAGVENMTPPDAVAQAVWDQCQHGTDYFFPWHRLYLKYFEQVLRTSANDLTLRLPYWDYTNPSQLAMPAEFTTPTYVNAAGKTVENPLYEPRRQAGWNTPSTNKLSSTDTNIDQKLDIPKLLNSVVNGQSVQGYQRTIELSPHGYTHCAVMGCRATVMGAVPYSSNDPIFYLHHANIDRTWQCWMSMSGHDNPGGAWLTQPFSFISAKGLQVTNRVADLFRPGFIDYVYEQPSRCKRTQLTLPKITAKVAQQLRRPLQIGLQTDDFTLDAAVARKRVTLPATASLTHPRQFALREQDQLPVAVDVILRGIRFTQHPNAEFRVYLERVDNPAARHFLGTLSFFSQEPVGSPHAQHGMASSDFTFDATEALRALRLEGTGTLAVHVVVEVEEDDRQDFAPNAARVVIDEIEFQVRRDL